MTDFTVVHDSQLKLLWERMTMLESQIAKMQELMTIECNHEFSTQSMTCMCHHCGIKRAHVPQVLVDECNHFWVYPEPRSLPECKHCGAKTL